MSARRPERRGLGRREQVVVEVAAGRVARGALEAEQLPGVHDLANVDLDLPEVRVDAPVAVPVVDHHDQRELEPQVVSVQAPQVGPEVADPAQQLVEVPARGEHGAVVGRHDPVAAEGRDVDAVVESLAVDEQRAPRRRAERQRQARVGDRPGVAGEGVDGGGPGRQDRRRLGASRLDRADEVGRRGSPRATSPRAAGAGAGDRRDGRRRLGAGHLAGPTWSDTMSRTEPRGAVAGTASANATAAATPATATRTGWNRRRRDVGKCWRGTGGVCRSRMVHCNPPIRGAPAGDSV